MSSVNEQPPVKCAVPKRIPPRPVPEYSKLEPPALVFPRINGRSHAWTGPAHHRNVPIIVHCHLCWDWVWQRPQQFMSRISERHKILFVETVAPDPALLKPQVKFRTVDDYPNITVLR